jgi:hypothetical protein
MTSATENSNKFQKARFSKEKSSVENVVTLWKLTIQFKHDPIEAPILVACPQGCFLFLEGVNQLGGANMPPRDVYYLFEGVGYFPSSPQTVTIEFLSFPSKSHQNPFVLIKFPNNSHQIPPVPINSPSNFFCSHHVLKKFSSSSSCSHQ